MPRAFTRQPDAITAIIVRDECPTKAHGMGVGLAISRSIIENHAGFLWAEPNEGPGATFGFSIPYLSSEARQ